MKGYDIAPTGAVQRARRLRRDMTDAEKRLWRALREALPHAKFRRQSPVGPYIADFLSYRHRLIVEVDGGQHATTQANDARRTAFLKAQGYRVLRFWNNDVLQNTDGVLETIARALDPHPDPLPKGRGRIGRE
jgi:very-short-patch-repair endonuclease